MAEPSADPKPRVLPIHYEKAALFRVIHADGVHGGMSPNGRYIVMSLFSERQPIPMRQELVVNEKGTPTETRPDPANKKGIFREVEAGVVMDLLTAQMIHEWLGEKIEGLRDYYRRLAELGERGNKDDDSTGESSGGA